VNRQEDAPVPDRQQRILNAQERSDAKLIWSYHQMGHTLRSCSAPVVFGCHDIGVAEHAARLHAVGMFPVLHRMPMSGW
jgi:hypothetical protein